MPLPSSGLPKALTSPDTTGIQIFEMRRRCVSTGMKGKPDEVYRDHRLTALPFPAAQRESKTRPTAAMRNAVGAPHIALAFME
jgi:hypothetical protein